MKKFLVFSLLVLSISFNVLAKEKTVKEKRNKTVEVDIFTVPHHHITSFSNSIDERECVDDIVENGDIRYIPLEGSIMILSVGGSTSSLYYDKKTDKVCMQVKYGINDNEFCTASCVSVKKD